MVREPELGNAVGHMWALWLHSLPNSTTTASVTLGSAIVLPSLEHLPDALAASETSISHSGEAFPGLYGIFPERGWRYLKAINWELE